METKYYVNAQGDYLGGFCGSSPPTGAIEIPTPPAHGLDKWINGAWVDYVPVPTKIESLSTITVTTQAGNTFDGNETARNNMLSAIATAEFLGETSSNWKMADNSKVTITLNELKEALALSIKKVGLIVGATE